MEKKLFIQLVEEFKKYNFAFKLEEIMECDYFHVIEKAFKIDNSAIKDILSSEDVKLKVAKFYLYSKTSELPDDIREEIKIQVEKGNVNIYSALEVIEHYNSLGRKDVIDFVRAIANATLEYQAKCAKEVALDQSISSRPDAIKFVDAIAGARYFHQAEYAKEVALNSNVLSNKNAIKVVRLIVATPFEYQAKYATFVATDLNVLKREDAVDIVRAVAGSIMDYQAKYASFVALNEHVLERDDALEIVTDVSGAKCASEAAEMAKRVENILSPAVGAKKLVANQKGATYIEGTIGNLEGRINDPNFMVAIEELDCDDISLDTKVKMKIKS